jgi:5,10-methylene-tetrahydrofolate dehydrogenase/methenyl tetrahydrofolate cyclohydrolase
MITIEKIYVNNESSVIYMLDLKRLVTKVQKTLRVQRLSATTGVKKLIFCFSDITERDLIEKISQLNGDSSVHGIIVQLPLDSAHGVDGEKVTEYISESKDVDGLTTLTAGKLSRGEKDIFGKSHNFH